jgi:hypothetical protein
MLYIDTETVRNHVTVSGIITEQWLIYIDSNAAP